MEGLCGEGMGRDGVGTAWQRMGGRQAGDPEAMALRREQWVGEC